ncbi:MAG: hypothetical protein NVSMB16_00960 [Acidimicrobiales bacterium]
MGPDVPPAAVRRQSLWRRTFGPFWYVFIGVAIGCAVLAFGVGGRYLFFTSADDAAVKHATLISDSGFEQSASGICKQYVHIFDTATTLSKEPSQVQAGDFVEAIAAQFDTMVVQLKTLPVAPADQAAVNQWFADWDAYNAYGHRYAGAVRSGSERDLVVADSKRIGALRRHRNGFARANHMGSCAFS